MVTPIFAVASGLANAIMACALKGAQNAECRIVSFGAVSMTLAALLAFIFVPAVPGSYSIGGVWIIGFILGALMSTAILSIVLANKEGPPSLAWCMANLGLIVPIALAAIFMNEPLHFTDTFLVGSFVLMLWMFKRGMSMAGDFSDGGRPLLYVILLIVIFISNGLLMFGFKLNEMLYPLSNKACFVAAIYCGASMVFLLGGMFLKRRVGLPQSRPRELKWGMIAGAASVSAVLLLQAAMSLPAVVVFPITQGIALIGGVVLMAVIYKERVNNFKIAGIILGFAVIIQSILR